MDVKPTFPRIVSGRITISITAMRRIYLKLFASSLLPDGLDLGRGQGEDVLLLLEEPELPPGLAHHLELLQRLLHLPGDTGKYSSKKSRICHDFEEMPLKLIKLLKQKIALNNSVQTS